MRRVYNSQNRSTTGDPIQRDRGQTSKVTLIHTKWNVEIYGDIKGSNLGTSDCKEDGEWERIRRLAHSPFVCILIIITNAARKNSHFSNYVHDTHVSESFPYASNDYNQHWLQFHLPLKEACLRSFSSYSEVIISSIVTPE
jgi:hypothetical protein